MLKLYQNIKEYRKARNMTQTDLAKRMGYADKSAISKIESGKVDLPQSQIIKFAEVFGIDPGVLMGTEGTIPESDKKPIRIPVLGRVAAGIPVEAITDVIDYEELDPDKFCEGEYFALQIHGDSMEPRMRDGDVVIVRRQSDIESGDIAIVRVNGYDATCKKVLKQNDGIMIVGLNPSFTPIFYSKDQIKSLPVEIDGRVVELRAKF